MARIRQQESVSRHKRTSSRLASAVLLVSIAVTCRRHEVSLTNEYVLSLPSLTNGIALYLPALLGSRKLEDRLYLWALDPSKNESLMFRGEASTPDTRTATWTGTARIYNTAGSGRAPDATKVAILPLGAVVTVSPSDGETRSVYVPLTAPGRYVQRPHCLRCGCGQPSLKETAVLLCREPQLDLCGGRRAIGYANPEDPKADPYFADSCRWVLGDNQSVIVQRASYDQPSNNMSIELPVQILESREELRVKPRSCDPESGAAGEAEDLFVRFDGILLWSRTDERFSWRPCFPDARVVLSSFAPELLDEPPTNAERLLNKVF